MATPKERSPKRAKPQCVTTELPRFEAWPAFKRGDPAVVRAKWLNSKGWRCFAFILETHGTAKCPANEVASVCAVALARHFGGVADISRTEGEWNAGRRT